MNLEEIKKLPAVLVVIAEACILDDKKPGYRGHELPASWAEPGTLATSPGQGGYTGSVPEGKTRYYNLKVKGLPCRLRPGMVIRVYVDSANANTWYPGATEVIGWWPDPGQVSTWSAQSDAVLRAYDAKQTLTKDVERRLHLDALEPIRQAYRNSMGTHRVQILAQVVEFLTR